MPAASGAVTAAEVAKVNKVAQTAVSTEELLSGDSNILDELILMFEKGFNQPIIYWQVACVLGSLLLAWLLSKFIRKRLVAHLAKEEQSEANAILEEEGRLPEKKNDKQEAFWAKVRRSLITLLIRLTLPLLGMFFIAVSTFSVRLFNLLPKKALPIESIAWLILGAYVIIRTIVFVIHTISRKNNNNLDNFLTYTIWGGVALQIVGVLPKAVDFMQTTKIPLGSSNLTIWSIFLSIFSIAFALFVAKWIGQFFERWINSVPTIQSNVRVVIIRIVKVVLLAIAVLVGLSSVGIDITVLGVFGGAVGVGLGFGLQKIASNYVSGFIILLDRSIKIGDLVEVSGVNGIVADIKTRYTAVKAYDGSVTIIPNETFVTSNVKNTSYLLGPGRTTVTMSVDYSTDVDEIIDVMTEIVRKQPRVLVNPAPYTILTNFGADGIDLTSYFWVADPEKGTATLRSNISRAMLREFNKRKINIPFPQRDLHVVSMPDLICKVETGDMPTSQKEASQTAQPAVAS